LLIIGKLLLRRIPFNKRVSPSDEKPAIVISNFFASFFIKVHRSRISFALNLLSVLNRDKQYAGTLQDKD